MQPLDGSTPTQQQSSGERTSSSGDLREDTNKYDGRLMLSAANESDDDIRRVPEMGASVSSVVVKTENLHTASVVSQRKRSRTPADKEHKRLKRLLRNRVSAQQARERKKAYVSELETRTKELELKNSELEERISTLQNENFMLRQILKNTAVKSKGSALAGSSRADHGAE